MTDASAHPALARRLGLGSAVLIGMGSMMGAGVFVAWSPAAQSAGGMLLLGLLVAALVAFANATSSAQLAAVYPESGGTYIYGRERLGHWWGFAAGWCFVIGKTASITAIALAFGAYAAPEGWHRVAAVAAIIGLAVVNWFGVTRTAAATRVLVVATLLALAVATAAGAAGPLDAPVTALEVDFYGVLQSAGILFFAFAGYARIATMGEEVTDPARTIPRAIIIALGATVAIYAVVGVVLLSSLGADAVAASPAPVAELATTAGGAWGVVVRVGAAAASLGALLALMTGVGRTSLAMARHGDLPRWLAAVHPRHHVPHHAELVLAIVASVIVLAVDLRGAIAFSSFGVLLYYFVANVAAFTQGREQRRFPRSLQVFGALACLVLVVTLPPLGIAAGAAVLAVGLLLRLLVRRGRGLGRPAKAPRD